MKTFLSNHRRGGALAAVAILSAMTSILWAAPRLPGPPTPEAPPLYHEGFDEDYFFGETNAELAITGLGMLDESWSGYALDRSGETVTPFIIPALTSEGHTNVSSDTGGALRFWIMPQWSSQSVAGGAGPGANATLLQFDAVSSGDAAFVWSLDVSADGNTLALHIQTDSGIETAIAWPISGRPASRIAWRSIIARKAQPYSSMVASSRAATVCLPFQPRSANSSLAAESPPPTPLARTLTKFLPLIASLRNLMLTRTIK